MKKWSKGVKIKKGGLKGWHASSSERSRHRALGVHVQEDGYKTVIDRLEFIANVNEHRQPEVTRVARKDVAWLEELKESRGDD